MARDTNGSANRLKFDETSNVTPGVHKTNERDPETGYPIGTASFVGAASPKHGLPAGEEKSA